MREEDGKRFVPSIMIKKRSNARKMIGSIIQLGRLHRRSLTENLDLGKALLEIGVFLQTR